jgi:6-phosphofructokinase 1
LNAPVPFYRVLIEGEDYPPYKNGLPDYVVMKNEMGEKKLPSFEV